MPSSFLFFLFLVLEGEKFINPIPYGRGAIRSLRFESNVKVEIGGPPVFCPKSEKWAGQG